MKVEFDEIKGLTPSIWTEGREWMWMAKVWEILEKKGLTTYETQTEKLQVYMRAVSAAAVYLATNGSTKCVSNWHVLKEGVSCWSDVLAPKFTG